MAEQDLVEGLCEVLCAVLVGDVPVGGVGAEELGLGVEGVGEGLVGVDVGLGAVDDADEAELERVDAAGEDVEGVGAGVHEVELGEDADGAPALGVDGAGELEGFGIGEVDVCGGDGEDHAGGGLARERRAGKERRTSWAWRCSRGRGSGFVARCRSVGRLLGSGTRRRI